MKRSMNYWMTRCLFYGLLTSIAILCLLPIWIVVFASITDEKSLAMEGFGFWPKEFSLEAYRYIFNDAGQVVTSYRVTILVTLIGTVLSLFVTSLLAYPMSRKDFVYRSPLSFLVFFTMLFNGGLVPFYILVSQYLHLKDTIWVLIIPGLLSPFFVLLMRTFFTTIPDSLIESAMIEGAGELRMYAQIIIPLSLPILATIGLFTSLNYWNDWFNSLLFIDDRKLIPLQYLLVMMMSNIQAMAANPNSGVTGLRLPEETSRMAMAVLAIGPIAFVYLFFQRFLVRGITVGAVKG